MEELIINTARDFDLTTKICDLKEIRSKVMNARNPTQIRAVRKEIEKKISECFDRRAFSQIGELTGLLNQTDDKLNQMSARIALRKKLNALC